jgi:hypothetical protein
LPLFSIAAPQSSEYHCPSSIDASHNKVTPWELIPDALNPMPLSRRHNPPFILEKVGLYLDSHNEMGELIPDNDDNLGVGGKEKNALWNFFPEERYWVACSYQNTNLLARQKLPAGVKSCEEIDDVSPKGKLQGIQVVCKV